MANLVIDVGNTSVALKAGEQVFHVDGGFAAAAEVAREALENVAEVDYVSVVPDMDPKWRDLAAQYGKKFVQVAYPQGLRLKYDYPRPETIGADRLCDAEAAVEIYGAPVLVMDFGTALTAAIVTRDRVWQGGVIAPGFPLMRDYLFERTAQLPRMELGSGDAPKIGKSTEEAMRFGAIVGYRGMVKEIVGKLKRNYGEDFTLVATGGFARWALKDAGLPFIIDEMLTLKGCELICSRN
ncbi:MAG: type III pantothenate kinase [Kiritimatiellae bacterium]|nr:type III pantothenate kinase [Kiritimatiellia bacterium]